MKIIGIIGGIGSGKSKISEFLEKRYGAAIISADQVGHEIILKGNPAYEKIINFFGDEILDGHGEINRKILGDRVFKDPDLLDKLNSMTHPFILEKVKQMITQVKKEKKNSLIVLEAALVVGEEWLNLVDMIWLVACPIEIRAERLLMSRNLSKEKIEQIISHQESDDELRKYADIIIDNSLELDKTLEKVTIETLKVLEANNE